MCFYGLMMGISFLVKLDKFDFGGNNYSAYQRYCGLDGDQISRDSRFSVAVVPPAALSFLSLFLKF